MQARPRIPPNWPGRITFSSPTEIFGNVVIEAIASGLDWALVQPVGLTDGVAPRRWLASAAGERRKRTISRADLATFIAETLAGGGQVRETVVLSGLTIAEREFAQATP